MKACRLLPAQCPPWVVCSRSLTQEAGKGLRSPSGLEVSQAVGMSGKSEDCSHRAWANQACPTGFGRTLACMQPSTSL